MSPRVRRTRPQPLPPRDGAVWLRSKEAAWYLGVDVQTLYAWRSRGGGPPAHQVRGVVRYRRADLDAWMEQASRASPAA